MIKFCIIVSFFLSQTIIAKLFIYKSRSFINENEKRHFAFGKYSKTTASKNRKVRIEIQGGKKTDRHINLHRTYTDKRT